MADLYPIYLNLEEKPCLVVGGGKVALRKVTGLLDAGARVTVISPDAVQELKDLALQQRIRLKEHPFREEDLSEEWLVFCATDSEEVNRTVFEACEKARIPANVADVPSLCRFQVPARFKEANLQLALSTRGGSPALARRLREEMEVLLSPWAPRLVEWMRGLRLLLKETKPDDSPWRNDFLNHLVDTGFEEMKAMAQRDDRVAFDQCVKTALEKKLSEDG